MAYGLPVVATGWSGNTDFTHAHNAALVPFDLVRSQVAHGPYAAGTLWAEPRLHEAARLIRRVWIDPTWRAQIAQAGQETVATNLSASAVGSAIRARLEEIAGQSGGRASLRKPAAPDAARATAIRAAPLWGRMVQDMLRFPGYYAMRLHRVPLLMWRYGVVGTLRSAEVVASGAVEGKAQYLLSEILVRFRRRLQRWRYGSWRR